MLRFFRQIRQKLLAENKVSRYLVYAIGEIVLVVIGILIALQINNWNEQRKTANERSKLISALKSDAQTTAERLKVSLQMADDINQDLLKILDILNVEQESVSMDTLKTYTSAVFQVANFRPAMSAYETALSTGDIGLLKNDTLLDTFIEFKNNYDWFVLHQNISGDMVYLGSVWKFRQKLGSTRIFMKNMGDYPKRFGLSDDEFYQSLLEKDVYATFESMQWLIRNQYEALYRANEANARIIDILEEQSQN
ncbi:DUF6090 family protein [Flagellimonas allohymeniacidonis]|uniref:Uncharacterized protein n=1 Tax=Flagellimonas allohymeniacidonis TaxID=2517819 RepID=A0A4V2HSV8_9FLAO|nr:DUF6090 family protein [Allomuricauda hymeniacidonis]TAI49230.1 hypothetical protein EW142_05380 [Allomuricauda hymeniacidonis]